MPPERLILLSENGVVLSKVTLATATPKEEPVSSYVVESSRAPNAMPFAKRAEALECFEEEVARSRLS
jgi:hypothetical protein